MDKEKTEREDMLRKTKIGQFDRYLYSYRVSQGYRLSQLIFFESLLTTFEAISIFNAAGAAFKIVSSPKPNNHNQVRLKHTVELKIEINEGNED